MMISERLSEILKLNCHKNQVQNVVIDWLLNGTFDEKNDANCVIDNVDDTLKIVNGLNHQLNPEFKADNFKETLNSMIFKLLTTNDDYCNKTTRNRKNIEIRGWLVTAYAKTNIELEHKNACLTTLKGFLVDSCDRKVTIYWTLIAILYCYEDSKHFKLKDFVNEHFGKIAINSQNQQKRDRIYWLLCIWYVDNGSSNEQTKYLKIIKDVLTIDTNNPDLTEFFAALCFRPTVKIIKEIQKFIDDVIEKDMEDFWEEKDIHMYKYLIICIREYGSKQHKKTIGDAQVNIYYKVFKLLTITRSYSSRIWNEIKLQLLKSLRIYNRVTNKRIVDDLKEELLNSDITIVFETCKTLKSIFDLETALCIIIDVLYNESIRTVTFSQKRIFAIAYSLKILSLKEGSLINTLQELEVSYDDYTKKNIIRKLFTEMGGMAAIKKSQINADIREKYMTMTMNAQEKVEKMFHNSIDDAKKAFKISLGMNIIVFMVGILLLTMSGIMAITNGTHDKWAGIGVTSGTGFLSIIYSLFINKPSRKIRKNTNHLMRLKVIFLGYLRELTQMDQCFSKTLIDNDLVSQSILEQYVSKIKCSMGNSLDALRWEELLNNTQDKDGKDKILNKVVNSQLERDKFDCTKKQADSNLTKIGKLISGNTNLIILDTDQMQDNIKQIIDYLCGLTSLSNQMKQAIEKLKQAYGKKYSEKEI